MEHTKVEEDKDMEVYIFDEGEAQDTHGNGEQICCRSSGRAKMVLEMWRIFAYHSLN